MEHTSAQSVPSRSFDDAVFDVEDADRREASEEGRRDGAAVGFADAFALGIRQGNRIGAEIGYYTGLARAVVQLLQQISRANGNGVLSNPSMSNGSSHNVEITGSSHEHITISTTHSSANLSVRPTATARLLATATQLLDLAENIVFDNLRENDLRDKLDTVRAKFRQLRAQMDITLVDETRGNNKLQLSRACDISSGSSNGELF